MQPIQINSAAHLAIQISQQMHDHGWALVGTQYEGALFHFTVGLERSYDHPNLEVIGLDEERGKGYLQILVEQIQTGSRFKAGDFFSSLADGYDLFLVENPADPDGPPITGGRLRLVWPDAKHRYPWNPDCDRWCAAQTFLPPINGIDLENVQLLLEVLSGEA